MAETENPYTAARVRIEFVSVADPFRHLTTGVIGETSLRAMLAAQSAAILCAIEGIRAGQFDLETVRLLLGEQVEGAVRRGLAAPAQRYEPPPGSDN